MYTLDKPGMSTIHKSLNVLCEKGIKQQIGQATSSERGVLVTTCYRINENGSDLSPIFIISVCSLRNKWYMLVF